MQEKIIPGFEDYKINELGKITNIKTGRVLRTYLVKSGYVITGLWKNKKCISKKVHRHLAKAFIPNPLNLPQVNHIDGNKTNNSLDNLEWCTAKHNSNHAHKNGLIKVLTIN